MVGAPCRLNLCGSWDKTRWWLFLCSVPHGLSRQRLDGGRSLQLALPVTEPETMENNDRLAPDICVTLHCHAGLSSAQLLPAPVPPLWTALPLSTQFCLASFGVAAFGSTGIGLASAALFPADASCMGRGWAVAAEDSIHRAGPHNLLDGERETKSPTSRSAVALSSSQHHTPQR